MRLFPKRLRSGHLRVVDGRDPDHELEKLQRRFGAIRARYDRLVRQRKFFRDAKLPVWIGLLAFAAVFLMFQFSPFSALDTLRHIAAFPNCTVSRALGLAPAVQGKPGYWLHHDRDRDGIACEPWLGR